MPLLLELGRLGAVLGLRSRLALAAADRRERQKEQRAQPQYFASHEEPDTLALVDYHADHHMTSLEVNPGSPLASPAEPTAPSERAPADAESARAEPSASAGLDALRLEGRLRRGRSGLVRALTIVTGFAILAAIARGLLALLGARHEVTLSSRRGGLELVGRRSLLGISLGETRELIPASAVRRLSLAGDSALWAVVAALAVLTCAGAAATVLLLWGLVGRQPSWLALAGAVVGGGLLLDGAAYLWVRRSRARGRASLVIETAGRRYRLTRITEHAAHRLLDALREHKLG